MFTDSPSGDNLVGHYKFDEGTGTTVADSSSNSNALTLTSSDAFADSGTFTYGTSTLKMTGANKNINFTGNQFFYNLTLATGGDSNAITLNEINGNNGNILPNGILEVESGKLVSTVSEYVQIGKTYGNLKVAAGKGGIAFADLNRIALFQNSQSGQKDFPHADSADKDLTFQQMLMTSTSTIEWVMGGNMTFTSELEIGGGNTFNANGNTINCYILDMKTGGIIDLRNSTLKATASGGRTFQFLDSTLLSGNSIIQGFDSTKPVALYVQADGNHELVGTLQDCTMQTNGDITVIGSVIRCDASAAGANIRQWHHTLDTQQLLDADEAGDDDLRLTKPALDNALELQTR